MRRPWSEEEINALRDGWKAGMSMRQIGVWVGRTKSAVAGKLHSLGLKLPLAESQRRQRVAHEQQMRKYRKLRKERAALTAGNET